MTRFLRLSLGTLFLLALSAPASDTERILYEGKSEFNQQIIVTENDRGLRTLMFEKNGARQSVVKLGDPDHLELPYTSTAMVGLALCDEVRRVLVVGLGGGSIPMFVRKHFPGATIDAVEIDPEVVSVAGKFMGFREDPQMHVHTGDGRRFIEQVRQPYDIVFIDAFGPDSMPYHLATVTFLQSLSRALTPRGVVVSNIWSRRTNRHYDAMVRTYQEVFSGLCLISVKNAGNIIFVALPRAGRITRGDISRRAAALSQERSFPFSLGKLVSRGFRQAPAKDARISPLLDLLREPAQ
jgi:spermidine synthase